MADGPTRAPARGPSKHGPGCDCVRCVGFQQGNPWTFRPGHAWSETHGSYARSLVRLGPLVDERADAIRSALPLYAPGDEATVRALAITLIRVERAQAALEQLDEIADAEGEGPLRPYAGELHLNGKVVRTDGLREDLRGWLRRVESLTDALGLSPRARAKLGLDIVRAGRFTLSDLHAQAARESERELEP